MKFTFRGLGLSLCLILLCACQSPVNPRFIGDWEGEATTAGERTRLLLQIEGNAKRAEAYLTLEDIGVARWPATSLVGSGEGITVRVPSDSGPQTIQLSLEKEGLSGTWSEPRFTEQALVQLARSQSTAAFPERRLHLQGAAGTLGASYIVPESCSSCPGVVFLHGSGPQPRDSSRFIARALARQGIASLIFDKRGVGESDGDFRRASFEDLADDAIAAAQFLQSQANISGVGFYGHSQGGWIAPLAALRWPHSAFVVTSSGPAVSPAREAQWELVHGMEQAGFEDDVEQARKLIDQWHDGIRSGDWQQYQEKLKSFEDSPWYPAMSHFPPRPGRAFSNSYRLYMDFEPVPVFTALDVPMLAILAPADESIDAVETATILTGLRDSGANITVKLYPGYDHTLRRLGENGVPFRWPGQPSDLYVTMADFIQAQ